MDFTTAVKTALSRFADFSGRSCRAEYWYFRLAYFGMTIAVDCVNGVVGLTGLGLLKAFISVALGLFSLALLIPDLAVTFRRIHDTGRSAWWLLLILLPIIGWIVLLVWYCEAGAHGSNRFGPDPLGPAPNVADTFS